MDYSDYKIPENVKNIINLEFIVGNYTVPIKQRADETVEFATLATNADDVEFKDKLSLIIDKPISFIFLEKFELLQLIHNNYSTDCSEEDCLHNENEIELSRVEYIKQLIGNEEDNFSEEALLSLKEHYQNAIGRHEPIDRLYMLAYTFQEFVQTHPVVLLNSDLYKTAFKINEMMVDFYDELSAEATLNETK